MFCSTILPFFQISALKYDQYYTCACFNKIHAMYELNNLYVYTMEDIALCWRTLEKYTAEQQEDFIFGVNGMLLQFFTFGSSCTGPRMSPLAAHYECPPAVPLNYGPYAHSIHVFCEMDFNLKIK